MDLRLENRSGYDTEDLRRFVRRGLRACGVRRFVHVVVTSSPIRSRGCADVGGDQMSLAVAAPSRTTKKEFLRRLSRLLEHEAAHLNGHQHAQMSQQVLYSEGPTPAWARGSVIRYHGRAPNQMTALRGCGTVRGTRGARDFDKKALMRGIDKDLRVAERGKLASLREKIARAVADKRAGRPGVVEYCATERAKARARIADLKEQLRQEYRRYAYGERLGARGSCERAKREPKLEIQRLRIALGEERRFQAEMRRIAKGQRERRSSSTPATARERRGESDDEVRGNIPAELVPLFEKVKRSIKAGSRKSRTEAFMQYVEEHPRERYQAIEDETDALVRQLERRQRRGGR